MKIIARGTSPESAAIAQDEMVLFAVCCDCGESIIHFRVTGWTCDFCGKKFHPELRSVANYYRIVEGDNRYTIDGWVAGWLRLDPEEVVVTVRMNEVVSREY